MKKIFLGLFIRIFSARGRQQLAVVATTTVSIRLYLNFKQKYTKYETEISTQTEIRGKKSEEVEIVHEKFKE